MTHVKKGLLSLSVNVKSLHRTDVEDNTQDWVRARSVSSIMAGETICSTYLCLHNYWASIVWHHRSSLHIEGRNYHHVVGLNLSLNIN